MKIQWVACSVGKLPPVGSDFSAGTNHFHCLRHRKHARTEYPLTSTRNNQGKRLAIEGGSPAFPNGPPEWPIPDKAISRCLIDAHASGDWGKYHGRFCEQVANGISTLVDQDHVRLCSSGTIAVELALRGAGVKAGDEVVLAAYDFPGNFRSIEATGGTPVLVDIDQNSLAPGADAIASAVTPRTKAIIVSHLHGDLVDMFAMSELAGRHGICLIEDACQAPGAIVHGRMAGSWGDIAILSFGGSKLLTSGRGGAVATSNPSIFQRMKIFADRGNDAFPMSELQACVLPPQFARLEEANTQRRSSAQRLSAKLQSGAEDLIRPIECAPSPKWAPSYYKYSMLLNPQRVGLQAREDWLNTIQAEGIACHAGFRGFSKRSGRRCRKVGELPNAELASQYGIILHHPILLKDDPAAIERLAECMIQATKFVAARNAV